MQWLDSLSAFHRFDNTCKLSNTITHLFHWKLLILVKYHDLCRLISLKSYHPDTKMHFVERTEELNQLKEIQARNNPAFVVIYGRRRIGKTETVRQFCESNTINYLEFAGKLDQSKAQQVQGFARKLSRYAPDLNMGEVNSWQDIFYLLEDYIESQPKDKRLVIFLDELPWMDTQKSGFLGDLASFWNEYCSRKSNVTLIVCGSAASYMLKKILLDKGPLHGRVTNKIGMEQFNLKSTKVLLEANGWNLSNRSITDIYMALGGVAKYLISLNSQLTPVQAIQELCFSKSALLKDEYQTLFHSLFKDAKAHYAIMNLLANRWQGLTQEELSRKTGLSRAYITRALDELSASGFIQMKPLFGNKKREALYVGADMFSYFHHKWIAAPSIKDWSKTAFTQSYQSWSGFAFEKICHLHVDQIKRALGINGIATSTHYWSTAADDQSNQGTQIDLLIKHENGSRDIELVECKYYEEAFVISKSYKQELLRKRALFNESTDNKFNVRLVLCTAAGVARNEHFDELNPRVVTLDKLFD